MQLPFFAELTDLPEGEMGKTDTAPRFECPRCQSKEQHVLKYQGEQYLQCSKCKYWSTKATLDNPEKGGFKRGN